ncbi:MAG: hypothetical protein DDT27_01545 [Dehalococcoidia bacterium]|nr:hypothetical protein [Chloroflexota bacterium]MBT9162978.1 hypothetical protein [Chloroflexota bacterium]
MDIRYFLERRLAFIEQYYTAASVPFLERKRKIEAGEEPFVPPCSEDGEPPYLKEWLEADESLQILGQTCISMLSASLHLYFTTWQHHLSVPVAESLKPTFTKSGWFNGYKRYFSSHFNVNFENSGCNLQLLEELVLARNRVQHPMSITSSSTNYSDDDLKKLPSPFFVSEREFELMVDTDDGERRWLVPPKIIVNAKNLLAAISEIRRFSEWLEVTEH